LIQITGAEKFAPVIKLKRFKEEIEERGNEHGGTEDPHQAQGL
jgi:hypothetical protein